MASQVIFHLVASFLLFAGVEGWKCAKYQHYFSQQPDYIDCVWDCCGNSFNRHCCAPIGIIVGCIIVGAVVVAALVVLMACWWHRRRARVTKGPRLFHNRKHSHYPVAPSSVTRPAPGFDQAYKPVSQDYPEKSGPPPGGPVYRPGDDRRPPPWDRDGPPRGPPPNRGPPPGRGYGGPPPDRRGPPSDRGYGPPPRGPPSDRGYGPPPRGPPSDRGGYGPGPNRGPPSDRGPPRGPPSSGYRAPPSDLSEKPPLDDFSDAPSVSDRSYEQMPSQGYGPPRGGGRGGSRAPPPTNRPPPDQRAIEL